MGEMSRAENLQVPRAEIRTASPDRILDIGTPEEVEGDVFNPEEARKRSVELAMEIDKLQASIDKQKSDLQNGLEASKKLSTSPNLVRRLAEEAQAVIDDLDLQKIKLGKEKEKLDNQLVG